MRTEKKMTPKLVASFRRSLSFPNPPSHSSSDAKPRKALHVRSASLPCCSHPIISQLRDEIAALHSWSTAAPVARTSVWLCHGLRHLRSVHDSLEDLLHLPQMRESLRGGAPGQIDEFLEHFLLFVDLYGTFQTLALQLKEELSAAQIAIRRKDDSEIASCAKNLNRIAKEIGKLASNYTPIGKVSGGAPYDDVAELIEVIDEVLRATCTVSSALFGGLSSSSAFRRPSCMAGLGFGAKAKNTRGEGGIMEFQEMNLENVRKLRDDEEVKMASKKMHEMEDRILKIEGCGERAFRSIINTRVSLLNVVTQ